MNEIDADGGGELEQDEFIEFLKREDERIEYSKEECERIFSYFLPDEQTNTIGFDELKHMFACLGEKISDGEVSKMIIYADKNRDERLDFQEFCKVIKEM
jgi:Ca2+-binding EF-hand superfamily protein